MPPRPIPVADDPADPVELRRRATPPHAGPAVGDAAAAVRPRGHGAMSREHARTGTLRSVCVSRSAEIRP